MPAIVAGLILAAWPVSATPIKDPHRWLDAEKVDLVPLFHWWTKHAGDRPLTYWVHVTGSIIQTNTWGWLLDAHLENSPARDKKVSADVKNTVRIILKNPPLRKLAEFQGLVARQHSLNSQREVLSSRAIEAGERAQALSAQQKADHRAHVRSAQSVTVEYKKWRQIEKQAQEQLKEVDQKIKDLKLKLAAFPDSESYIVDCFALDTGQRFNGIPVFDHGKIAGSAPQS